MKITRAMWALMGVGAVVVAVPGLAWACLVPGTSANLTMTGPGGGAADAYNSVGMYGPVGSYVSISGQGWEQGAAVQFTWGTTVPGATVLATLPETDSSFHVTVRVPSGAPGEIYMISAAQPDAQKPAFQTGTGHPFLVTNPDGSLPANTAKKESPAGETSTAGSGGLAAGPGPAPAAVATEPSASAQSAPAATSGAGASTVVIPNAPAATGSTPQAAATVLAAHAVAPRTTEAPVPARAATAATAAAQPVGAGTAGHAPSVATAPSLRSVTGELWSGFADGSDPATSLVALPAAPTAGTSQPALGVGLLGLGVVALFGGFGVAELRRRRVTVPNAS